VDPVRPLKKLVCTRFELSHRQDLPLEFCHFKSAIFGRSRPLLFHGLDNQCHHNLCTSALKTNTMDRKDSKLHKTAMAARDKAVDWLQKKLQMPSSQKNSPSQPPRPANTASIESCLNGYQATGFDSTSPMRFDRIKLHFKVHHYLLSLLSLSMSKLH
jgi:hypothetical protein